MKWCGFFASHASRTMSIQFGVDPSLRQVFSLQVVSHVDTVVTDCLKKNGSARVF